MELAFSVLNGHFGPVYLLQVKMMMKKIDSKNDLAIFKFFCKKFKIVGNNFKTYLSPSANLCKMHIKDVNDDTNDKTLGLSTHSFSSVVLFLLTMS